MYTQSFTGDLFVQCSTKAKDDGRICPLSEGSAFLRDSGSFAIRLVMLIEL